jgi:hypothetical protein
VKRAALVACLFHGARRAGCAALMGVLLMTPEGAEAAMSITDHPVTIDHVEIHSTRDFDEVAKWLESALPPIEPVRTILR